MGLFALIKRFRKFRLEQKKVLYSDVSEELDLLDAEISVLKKRSEVSSLKRQSRADNFKASFVGGVVNNLKDRDSKKKMSFLPDGKDHPWFKE